MMFSEKPSTFLAVFLVDLPPSRWVIIHSLTHIAGETPVPIPSERGRCTIWPGQYVYKLWTTSLMWYLTFSEPLYFVPLPVHNIWIPSYSHSATCQYLISSWCRSLYNGHVCCTMLFQHNTKPKTIWGYRFICPRWKWERENGYREHKIECRIAVSLSATRSALGTEMYLCYSMWMEEQVPRSLVHPASLECWMFPRIIQQINTD